MISINLYKDIMNIKPELKEETEFIGESDRYMASLVYMLC